MSCVVGSCFLEENKNHRVFSATAMFTTIPLRNTGYFPLPLSSSVKLALVVSEKQDKQHKNSECLQFGVSEVHFLPAVVTWGYKQSKIRLPKINEREVRLQVCCILSSERLRTHCCQPPTSLFF